MAGAVAGMNDWFKSELRATACVLDRSGDALLMMEGDDLMLSRRTLEQPHHVSLFERCPTMSIHYST